VVIVKPGFPYLDVVHAVKTAYPDVPLAAYHVSGEYSMLKAAALRGSLDEKKTPRAGCIGGSIRFSASGLGTCRADGRLLDYESSTGETAAA